MVAIRKTGAILVIGGGIAGMQAALDLADAGFYVHLVEKTGAIGGAMPRIAMTYPTPSCSLWGITPQLVACAHHRNIHIITNAEVEQVHGLAGDFTAHVKQMPRYVDQKRCIACGQCAAVCPELTRDTFDGSLSQRKAIFIKYPQAIPFHYEIDASICLQLTHKQECGLCRATCPTDAIDFHDAVQHHTFPVGAVILAPGCTTFQPGQDNIWGYGRFPNVLTAIELERLLAPDGPTRGSLLKPLDNMPPKSIAFLQCVGSRDRHRPHNEYCSSVCCMHAIKEAIMIRNQLPDAEITLYCTDIRIQGKDCDRYLASSQEQYDIHYTRAKLHRLEPEEGSGRLRLHTVNTMGKQVEKTFDMVILSVGLKPSDSASALAERMGVHLTPDRFASTSAFMPVSTSREGIFSCGAFNGPQDIPQAVTEGSAAAACAAELLKDVRYRNREVRHYPANNVSFETNPRIGVYLCHCGPHNTAVVDEEKLAQYAWTLPNVIHVEQGFFSCAQKNENCISSQILSKKLDRIVVVAGSPRGDEDLIRQRLQDAGIHEKMIEMADIQNQNAWGQQNDPEQAAVPTENLVRAAVATAVAKVTLQKPLLPVAIPVIPTALIIGGGLAGMTSALNLARQGFKVDLIEKTSLLGGNAQHLYQTWNGEDVSHYLEELRKNIRAEKNITVHMKTTVRDSNGHVGHFHTTIQSGKGREKTIPHGVVIIASGGKRYIPTEFGYGKIPNVVALLEFDKLHTHNEVRVATGKTFVFIQCVGSRNKEHPYCSKYCCTQSIQSAIKLKQEVPSRRIFILYREIHTYGQREKIYNQARALGIPFIKYQLQSPPVVCREENKTLVKVHDHVLHLPLEIEADLVILASATLANPDAKKLAALFTLPLNTDGFFQEAHAQLRPVELQAKGIFVTGLALYPKPIEEAITQSLAAAGRAAILLNKKTIELDALSAQVIPEQCDGCAVCIEACPCSAITLLETVDTQGEEQKIAEIDPVLCTGCGICQGICPNQGVSVTGCASEQIAAERTRFSHGPFVSIEKK
ncbi:MAG: heterodisulfide reductase [Desulfobulbus propionicus]|nr:MAG: heterodisulfide reductase [Desulfobulbus propionicus]